MTIPEDPAHHADWLENILVRGEMVQLVSELETVHGKSTTPISLQQVCGKHLSEVHERGLSALPVPLFSKIFKNPRLLLALTADVLENGGPYWDQKLETEESETPEIESSWERLQTAINREAPVIPIAEALPATPVRRKWQRSVWFVGSATALATAATIIIGILYIPGLREKIGPQPQSVQSEVAARWGWLKADDLSKDLSAPDYLDQVAQLAEEWQSQKTDSPIALSERILDLRRGCARLQLADHPQLTADQKNGLLKRCRKWADKLDQQLADLEKTGDVDRIRSEVTEMIRVAAQALRADADRIRKNAAT